MKLACPTFNGVPDLYVISRGHMPILLEAKWLGEITAHNFNRKINYTAMQVNWLKESNEVQPNSALGLIGFKFQGEIYCVLVGHEASQLNYGFKRMWPWVVYKNKMFDIQDLFDQSNVPRMALHSLYRLPIPAGHDNMGFSTKAGRLTEAPNEH